MGFFKSIGEGIRNLGEAGKELFRGIGDAIAGVPRTVSETYTQRQKTVRQRERLASFERTESSRAVATRQDSGAPAPSVGVLPATTVAGALWDPAQARHEMDLEQRRSELRLGEMHAQHLLNLKEIAERGVVERTNATHGAELERGTATHRAELARRAAEHRAELARENQRYTADLESETEQTQYDTEFYRAVSPFAELHPVRAAAQVAAQAKATAPTLVLAPMRVVGAPGGDPSHRDEVFERILEEQLAQDLRSPGLAHVFSGLFRRPFTQSEADVGRVREALCGLPVILLHGEIVDGYRAWIHLLAWNVFTDTPATAPAPEPAPDASGPSGASDGRERPLHEAARPQGLLLPPAVRLTLPFPVPDASGKRAHRKSQEQIARAAGAVSAMLAQWYGVAAGEAPRATGGLPDSLAPVPEATALGTGAVLDLCVDRGLRDESDALIHQADVYRQSGFTEYALDSARRAARIITPGDPHDQLAYLDRVDRLVTVLEALNEHRTAGDVRARAEQAARRSTRRHLYGSDDEGPDS
ncbi:hypothetical protein ABZ953_03555 [Streptomyces sp. NPDC046465]|uniref:hypothetical protein n=1 Tax=Streptomyces sp. NPDC046465 TaxID=3155810 RepID=UPI00340CC399